jgi:predicted AlkP superfamily phosphohydrolase/phosphomutase
MFLNLKGREEQGIVDPGQKAEALKKELTEKLTGLQDEEENTEAIRDIFDTSGLYRGPYVKNAPDLLIGYNKGYRISWDCASGVVAGSTFEDNTKAWSGDHCVDPRQVPGIFFCSHEIDRDDPALMDVAPTALKLFGVEPPKHMDGQPLFSGAPRKAQGA